MEPDLEGILGAPNCFPGVLITGSHYLFDSGVVDPRDDTCNFNSSRGCQDELSKLAKVVLFSVL